MGMLPPLTVALPSQENGNGENRFDLSVVNAPAAQVFMAIVTGTKYNMLVGPEVTGTITVNLKDVTVREALESIRDLYGYEFSIKGSRIAIQPNTLRTQVFQVNYLASIRSGESQLRVTSSAITTSGSSTPGTGGAPIPAGTGTTGTQTNNPPTSHVTTNTQSNFWRELEDQLKIIVPTEGGRNVVVNKTSGVVLIRAFPNEMRSVEQYLKATKIMVERQVMLEAKILEVYLKKEYQAGINWASFNGNTSVGVVSPGTSIRPRGPYSIYESDLTGNIVGMGGNIISSSAVTQQPGSGVHTAAGTLGTVVASALGKGFVGLAFQTANFAALLNFLETQGSISVLSSPRIATLNNQKAVLKVGTDELYVTNVTTTTTTNTGGGSVSTPSLTLQPYFSGISLDVTPQIDDEGNIILHVHPAISVVEEKQKRIDLGTMGNYQLPLASSRVNETDSIVRVQDGSIVAIGGLMTEGHIGDRSGLPGTLNSTAGALAGQRGSLSTKRELVILLKPTIISDDRSWARDIEQTAERMRNIDLPPLNIPVQ
jgi:MSHA biogenesis protein MshL